MQTLNIDYRDHSWHSKANKDKQRPLSITKQRNEETINWLKILEICVAPSIPSPAVLSQLLPSRRWGLKIVVAAWSASVSCGTALATVAPGAGKQQLGKIISSNIAQIGHEDQEKWQLTPQGTLRWASQEQACWSDGPDDQYRCGDYICI